jgi:hypothetical protein
MELAKTMAADQDIVICLSGRGDKGIVNSQSTLLTSQMFKALLKNFLGSVRKLAGIFGFNLEAVRIITLRENQKIFALAFFVIQFNFLAAEL